MAPKGPAVAAYTPPLISLLLALVLSSHFTVTNCSRPSPEELQALAVHPVLRDAAGETRALPVVAEAEGWERTAASAATTSATAASAHDEVGRHTDGVAVGSGNSGGAQQMVKPTQPPVLARRFMSGAPAVEGGSDSAARSSCHSNDPHIGCDPHN